LTLSHTVDVHTLKQVYYAYFQSHISYGVIFWGNSSDSSKVFVMQKKVIRLITKSAFNESCRDHFRDLKILPLPSLYIFSCVMFVYSNLEMFYSRNHHHTHFTRNSSVLQYPNHRTSFLEKAPFYSCITLFNSLPINIKNLQSKSLFKKSLLRYLTMHCFYSVNEYLALASGRAS